MKRPFGVTLLGMLLLLQGLFLTLEVAFALLPSMIAGVAVALPLGLAHQSAELTGKEVLSGATHGIIGLFSLATGIGMLRLRAWAWFVAMVLQGVTLATLLSDYFLGRENPVNMLLAAVIVFYLNMRSVRQIFQVGAQREQSYYAVAPVAPPPATDTHVTAPHTPQRHSGSERSG